jgi:hypothetical protein
VLHKSKTRKLGETVSPRLDGWGAEPPKKLSVARGFPSGVFRLLDTIKAPRPACLVRALNHPLSPGAKKHRRRRPRPFG